MSIYGALFSGVSGLAAQAQAMGMLSDNITNVNTVGFKETTARFSSLVTSSATATAYAPGGVRSTPQQLIDKQGLLTSSVSPTDLAINGAGFMVVTDTPDPGSDAREFLTRAGSFTPDVDGYLKNAGGYYLRAYEISDAGATATTLSTVNVANFPPTLRVTENVGFQANLQASEDVSTAAETAASTAEFDVVEASAFPGGGGAGFVEDFSINIGAVTVVTFSVAAATDGATLASTIQTQLQTADGGATNITVSFDNDVLTVSDRLGRAITSPTLRDGTTADIDATVDVTASTYNGADTTINMASGNVVPDFSRSVEIYDSLGTPRTLTYGFLKSATANQWHVEVFVEPSSLADSTVVDGQVMRGVIAFNTNGTWDLSNTFLTDGAGTTLTDTAGDYTVDVPFDTTALGIDAQTITFDWGTDGEADGMTQYDGESTLVSTAVDGAQVGQLAAISIDENGVLTAIFENGITQDKYQIPIGLVPNANGLGAHSGNVFIQTAISGDLTKRVPGTNGAGLFAPSSLEASTVDLANEFSKMIMAQRAFSAAAKIITTADEMLDELLRTKR